jgi:hypothetical protein
MYLVSGGKGYAGGLPGRRPIMRNRMFVVLFVLVVACGCGIPEGDAPDEVDVASAEFGEGGDLEEEGELEIPPEGSIPLSEIIANMEIEGHTFITEVEFEDGVWKVEFVVGDEEFELEIDPMTGEALSDEPRSPDDD